MSAAPCDRTMPLALPSPPAPPRHLTLVPPSPAPRPAPPPRETAWLPLGAAFLPAAAPTPYRVSRHRYGAGKPCRRSLWLDLPAWALERRFAERRPRRCSAPREPSRWVQVVAPWADGPTGAQREKERRNARRRERGSFVALVELLGGDLWEVAEMLQGDADLDARAE